MTLEQAGATAPIRREQTDRRGRVVFRDPLEAGVYRIVSEIPGYKPILQDTIVGKSEEGMVPEPLEIELSPKLVRGFEYLEGRTGPS